MSLRIERAAIADQLKGLVQSRESAVYTGPRIVSDADVRVVIDASQGGVPASETRVRALGNSDADWFEDKRLIYFPLASSTRFCNAARLPISNMRRKLVHLEFAWPQDLALASTISSYAEFRPPALDDERPGDGIFRFINQHEATSNGYNNTTFPQAFAWSDNMLQANRENTIVNGNSNVQVNKVGNALPVVPPGWSLYFGAFTVSGDEVGFPLWAQWMEIATPAQVQTPRV